MVEYIGLEKGDFMIKFVFLDLDNTLLDFRLGEYVALKKALKEMQIPADDRVAERYLEINHACWRALERGEITRDQVLYGRFEKLFSELGIDASAKETQDLYQELLSREHEFMPGAKELLDGLKNSGKYHLYIATNGIPEVQYPRISDSAIGSYFDEIFISYEIGYPKPKKEFFEGCFAKIADFDPKEAIIIGDSLTSDVQGGINAGMLTCHYNVWKDEQIEIKPDYTINNLSELIPLLESIK